MVQQVEIPLSWANNIPGVSGIRDVEFSIPDLEDVVDAIVANTLDRTDVDEAVTQAVEAGLDGLDLPEINTDQLVQDIEEAVEIDVPDLDLNVDALADEIARQIPTVGGEGDQINIEGVFGPLTEDVVRGIEQALEDVPDVDDLEVPSVSEIEEALQGAVEDVLGAPTLVEAIGQAIRRAVDQGTDEATQTLWADLAREDDDGPP